MAAAKRRRRRRRSSKKRIIGWILLIVAVLLAIGLIRNIADGVSKKKTVSDGSDQLVSDYQYDTPQMEEPWIDKVSYEEQARISEEKFNNDNLDEYTQMCKELMERALCITIVDSHVFCDEATEQYWYCFTTDDGIEDRVQINAQSCPTVLFRTGRTGIVDLGYTRVGGIVDNIAMELD